MVFKKIKTDCAVGLTNIVDPDFVDSELLMKRSGYPGLFVYFSFSSACYNKVKYFLTHSDLTRIFIN